MTTKAKPKRNVKAGGYRLFWLILVICFGVFGAMRLNQYNAFLAEQNDLLLQIEVQESKNAELRRELEYYGSDTYVERIARERLGLVKPDEIVYIKDTTD